MPLASLARSICPSVFDGFGSCPAAAVTGVDDASDWRAWVRLAEGRRVRVTALLAVSPGGGCTTDVPFLALCCGSDCCCCWRGCLCCCCCRRGLSEQGWTAGRVPGGPGPVCADLVTIRQNTGKLRCSAVRGKPSPHWRCGVVPLRYRPMAAVSEDRLWWFKKLLPWTARMQTCESGLAASPPDNFSEGQAVNTCWLEGKT